ncbi:MAG: DNA polymerase III subunit epsilon [Pseudomonadota bacterium]
MREIVLDTETTGLDAKAGDRIIEIGCVELLNRIPSGAEYHVYINPEHPVSQGAVDIHGLDNAFLDTKPVFSKVAPDFLSFIGEARLIIHNAPFDIGFINAEFARVGEDALGQGRVVDTLVLARRRFPGGGNRLDDLCARFGIDNSNREKHGALLDAQLLAEVYLELMGERQAALGLDANSGSYVPRKPTRPRSVPLPSFLSDDDIARHAAFVASIGATAAWQRFLDDDSAYADKDTKTDETAA